MGADNRDGGDQQGFIDQLAGELGMQFEGGGSPDEDNVTVAPATEPPTVEDDDFETDAPSTDAPIDEGDEDEYETTAAPSTDAPTEEGEDEEEYIEISTGEFNKLVERLNKLGKMVQESPGATPATPTVQPSEAKPDEGTVKVSREELEKKLMLTPDELDRVVDEPNIINDAIKRIFDVFMPRLEAADNLPAAVEARVNDILTMHETATKFYESNPDMASSPMVQEAVQTRFKAKAAAMQAAGQVVDPTTVLDSIAVDIRKELGWKKSPAGKKSGKPAAGAGAKVTIMGEEINAVVKKRKRKAAGGKPTLPGATGGGRKGGKKGKRRKGEAGKIDDLLNELGAVK